MGMGPGSLPEDEVTLAEALRDAGFSTGMVGKWHLGGPADGRGLPTRHGFDSYWGMPVTNVRGCRAGHKEYRHASLLLFVLDRSPTGAILAALAALAIAPWLRCRGSLSPTCPSARWRSLRGSSSLSVPFAATHLPAASHHLQQPGLSAASHIPLNVDEEQLVKPGAELGQGVGAEPEG